MEGWDVLTDVVGDAAAAEDEEVAASPGRRRPGFPRPPPARTDAGEQASSTGRRTSCRRRTRAGEQACRAAAVWFGSTTLDATGERARAGSVVLHVVVDPCRQAIWI
jgi:hypothetical protein